MLENKETNNIIGVNKMKCKICNKYVHHTNWDKDEKACRQCARYIRIGKYSDISPAIAGMKKPKKESWWKKLFGRKV